MCNEKSHSLPAPLKAFCEGRLGTLASIKSRAWEHAESQVWEVWSEPGGRAFLKCHRQPRKFEQELNAYEQWLPALSEITPGLLAVHEGQPRALLLSAVPGELVETGTFSKRELLELYHQAGRVLAQLHGLPYEDDDAIPLHEAFVQRAKSWAERARGIISEKDIAWVLVQVAEAAQNLAEVKRVPCHRDYTARNWLAANGRLYVIDFEHSRPDWWLVDIEKLWSLTGYEKPALIAAFLKGYGHVFTPKEDKLLKQLAALNALSTIVWAREHQDKDFEAIGWRVLGRMKDLQRSD